MACGGPGLYTLTHKLLPVPRPTLEVPGVLLAQPRDPGTAPTQPVGYKVKVPRPIPEISATPQASKTPVSR